MVCNFIWKYRTTWLEWLQVPEYAKSLNDSLGPGSAATLLDEFGEQERRLRAQGRRLFERWLDLR